MKTSLFLSAILQKAHCDFVVFDLSRRVTQISTQQWIEIENNRQPYPFPIRQQAQLGFAFWKTTPAEKPTPSPWIWFLTFPLDERGLLNQTALGDFIQSIASIISAQIKGHLSQIEEEELANTPYIFTPQDDKKAVFHAKLTDVFNHPASQYYQDALDYLSGHLGWENWQKIGLQGFADVCARHSEKNHPAFLQKAIQNIPSSPKYALLGCLEHFEISPSLTQELCESIEQFRNDPEVDLFLVAAYIRGLAGADQDHLQSCISDILATPKLCHQEVLIALAGRCWHAFSNSNLLDSFLIRVAQQHDPHFFHQMIGDLVMLPALRPHVLALLHQKASPELMSAVHQLEQKLRSVHAH